MASILHFPCAILRSASLPLALFAGLMLVFSLSSASAMPEMAGQKTVEDRYAKMDADKDGKVTPEEFFATYPQMKEGAFKAIDENGDGFISPEEWKNFAAGHKSSDPHAGMGGAPAGGGGEKKEAVPSLIMPPGVGK